MVINTIVLDLDGPLLEGKKRHYKCYADILSRHGFVPLDIDVYWQMKRACVNRRDILSKSHAEGMYDTFLDEWLANIEKQDYLACDELQPNVLIKLKQWNEKGIKLILATMRKNEDNLNQQLQNLGLKPCFDSVVVCDHSKGGVGKAESVRTRYPDLNRGKCLWIGDTEADAQAAAHLGCPRILVSCGLRDDEHLKSYAPMTIKPFLFDVDISSYLKLS